MQTSLEGEDGVFDRAFAEGVGLGGRGGGGVASEELEEMLEEEVGVRCVVAGRHFEYRYGKVVKGLLDGKEEAAEEGVYVEDCFFS